ncbi:hypothetical protein [Actinacidiphila sp. ITFR-21]|uniref:hypothetical protein n=1 Tax=Actinacidiphila sp. ITFR-21 TaxID=3075199 RepID=UPI00288A9AE3|nr:hypothetical protein [Streptomyces sp. ITFR-21]WNI16628.1 hypothetical protein RLT57_14650 [Streptomyces sp. ITFR-21]
MAALVLGVVSVAEGWTGAAVLAGVVMVGVLVATARQRRTGPDPEVTIRPGDERAWRRRE